MAKTCLRLWLSFLLGFSFFPMLSAGTPAADSQELTLGTSTTGGGFSLFGQHLAAVINEADPGLRVDPIPTKGSRENLRLLEAGELDIALVEGNAARGTLAGTGGSPGGLKVLWVMYPNPGMFVVRADSPYKSIRDLKGSPIAFGTQASGLRILAADLLDGLGMTPDGDFQQIILDKAGEGPPLLLGGKVAALWGAGIGWPGFVKVAESPVGARFIAPDAHEIERIRSKHPHLRPMSVPAGSYPGQDGTIDSLGLWSLVLARPGLPEVLGYRLAGALHRGEAALASRLPQGGYATLANTAAEVPRARLQPGVARYLDGQVPSPGE